MLKMTFEEYRQMVVSEKFCTEVCPVQMLFDTFSNKWVLRVLFELTQADSLRFGQLKSVIGGSLSEKGKALYPIFREIINWAVEYGIEEKTCQSFSRLKI